VAGGNLIGGWAHARDLIYASSLFKAYNTEKKVYETLMLAEQAGISTINIGFPSNENGADFIRVGMFDFQVVTDLNITIDILNSLPDRKRNWFA
jgi:hypothetical protein